ncbi:hypothetical protein K7432_004775 [Basidiobolus ranarum]|uniref:F-box domain-containing protein n=1 Tax=Basidiobolus ranarum TaxID=34480 RepID=A0ABR2W428_9FUNG
MPRLADLPQELLLYQLKLFPAKELARLSVTNKFFNQVCSDDSLWSNICRPYRVTELGVWSGKTFKSLHYLLLSKWGWLIGLWFGNFPIIGELVQVSWRPEEGKLVASRVGCSNILDMRMEILSANPDILVDEIHTSFEFKALFSIGLDTITSNILTRCQHPDLLTQLSRKESAQTGIDTDDDLALRHSVSISKVHFYSHPKTSLWVSFPKQWELEYSNQQSSQTSERSCFSWMCTHHCHERSRFQVSMFVPSLAKLSLAELQPTPSLPLQGLWIGTYGPHGCEMLLFKYDVSESLLMASKITGDVNVPRGEITFVANLEDELSEPSSTFFSEKQVFSGQGQVASTGFLNCRMINVEFIWISNNEVAVYWCDLHLIGRYLRATDDHGQFTSRISSTTARP